MGVKVDIDKVRFTRYISNPDVNRVGGKLARFDTKNGGWAERINCTQDFLYCQFRQGSEKRYRGASPSAACGRHPDAQQYLELIPKT